MNKKFLCEKRKIKNDADTTQSTDGLTLISEN